MFYIDGDWLGVVVPQSLVHPDSFAALLRHVQTVEVQLEKVPTGKFRPYWAGRANKQCLRHFFNRALYEPGALDILQQVLSIACGDREMYEAPSWRAANMLLSILTNPTCAHIPVAMYPQLAQMMLPTVRIYYQASDWHQIAIALQLARGLSSTVIDGAAGGAGAFAKWLAHEEDSSAPGAR